MTLVFICLFYFFASIPCSPPQLMFIFVRRVFFIYLCSKLLVRTIWMLDLFIYFSKLLPFLACLLYFITSLDLFLCSLQFNLYKHQHHIKLKQMVAWSSKNPFISKYFGCQAPVSLFYGLLQSLFSRQYYHQQNLFLNKNSPSFHMPTLFLRKVFRDYTSLWYF